MTQSVGSVFRSEDRVSLAALLADGTAEERLVATVVGCRCAQDDILSSETDTEAIDYVMKRLSGVIALVDDFSLLGAITSVVRKIRAGKMQC